MLGYIQIYEENCETINILITQEKRYLKSDGIMSVGNKLKSIIVRHTFTIPTIIIDKICNHCKNKQIDAFINDGIITIIDEDQIILYNNKLGENNKLNLSRRKINIIKLSRWT